MTGRYVPIILAAVPVLAVRVPGASAEDFAAEVDDLSAGFADAVTGKAELEALYDRSRVLEKRLGDHEELEDEVDALQAAMRVVGQRGKSASTSLKTFDRATQRLGLESREVQALEPDVAVIQVDVGSYRSILLRNSTKHHYSLRYAWQTSAMERPQPGEVKSRCERVMVMGTLLNSREHDLAGLTFTELSVMDLGTTTEGLSSCR